MLSLGVGLQTLASQRLTRSGLFDAVFVTSLRNYRGPRQPPLPDSAAKRESRALDDDARQQLSKLSNVTEVYPQIRFITDVRYVGKSESTSVLGLPDSSRSSGAFEGMTGKYFSSPAAEEAILQREFAKLLADQPSSLVGKDLTLRYAERAALSKDADDEALLDAMMGSGKPGGISIVPREKTLRIVGITESDPSAGIGGFGGARVYLPLKTAEQLHVAQPDDVQAFLSGNPAKPSYMAMTVRVLFFAEAGAMGLFGGVFGVALGWLIGSALTWGTTIYLHRQNLPGVKISYVPWWLALSAIGFAIIVSLVAGLYPASRAARLN